MKKNTVQQYVRALYEVTRELADKEIPKVVDVFIDLVRRQEHGSRLARIADAYEAYEMKQEGRLPIFVKMKHHVDAKLKRKLRERFGEKREIVEMVAKEQKGGILVRDGDMLYDATLDRQLIKFHEHLIA